MKTGSKEKNFDIPFFYEKNLRAFLSRFYHSIVQSGENAQEILDADLNDFYPKNIAGDSDTQSSMRDVFRKLDYVRVFFKSDEIFETQILEPMKIASDLRIQFSKFQGGKRSSSLKGLVIARSKPERKDDGTTTLSMICPEIQSVMSIRMPNDRVPEKNGWMEFGNIQPIVLINRAHPAPGGKTDALKIQEKKDLLEFEFIFSSIADLKTFPTSLEMENFTEMSSVQSDKQRHLGWVFVSFGKVTNFDGQDMMIESVLGGHEVELTVASRNFKNNFDGACLEEMVGKTVAFLGTTWYKTRGKDDINMEFPELLDIQTCDDSSAIISEITGHVRLRRKCQVDNLITDLRIEDKELQNILSDILKSTSLKISGEGKEIEFVSGYMETDDQVKSSYVKALDSIRRRRFEAKSLEEVQVTQRIIVDQNKTNTEGIIQQLHFDCKAHEKIGCRVRLKIMKLVGTFEEKFNEGINAEKIFETLMDSHHPEETIRGQLWFLKNIVAIVNDSSLFFSKKSYTLALTTYS